MPHIPLPEHLPGITGLLEYNKETAAPIRELTQFLLRGESTLTAGERELIATIVSHNNACKFCTAAHTAAADLLIGNTETCEIMKQDIDATPVSDKMKALLKIAKQVQVLGKAVTKEAIAEAKNNGATDIEIHDTVLIAALFCLYNRYVDGMATIAPSNPEFYQGLGRRLVDNGYNRLANGYDHLKQQKQPS
ncbi:carboxymuconolactone decarboxylase family protein [Dyadobacter sp. LJ53]|uniref:carboxymuconolactone decarboxylase family protein n=1 Tax=Dyadobacter chenwenxiniae TaxID=2906456 RepID=UPI001F3FD301|nr:carboxymuconolactone decarboxylase family protein [Dyadobacter chenwenxiniae]MCF0050275.1 carboxymuconolactone decarboxylase family protein [Dyadobacter chenwenxiniae]